MKIHPSPFSHCANWLTNRGYGEIVVNALSLAMINRVAKFVTDFNPTEIKEKFHEKTVNFTTVMYLCFRM